MEVGETVFRQGLCSIFHSWPALKIAIDRGSGGRNSVDKANWLPDAIATWVLENNDVETYEIEDCISSVLDEDFQLIVDDGSLSEVALAIHQCYSMYRQSRFDEIESKFCHLEATKVTVQEALSDSDEDEKTDEPEDIPDLVVPSQVSTTDTLLANGDEPMEQDNEIVKQNEDDGWQQVKRGKGRRK